MHGKVNVKLGDNNVALWFNNYSKVEIARLLLPPRGGYPAKPEELALLKAIDDMARANHVRLMSIVIQAGVLGQAYGTNQDPQMSPEEVAATVATANEDDLYQVWNTFLDSMGMNLDDLLDRVAEAKKKRMAQQNQLPRPRSGKPTRPKKKKSSPGTRP